MRWLPFSYSASWWCSDDEKFGGSGYQRASSYDTHPEHFNGYEQSIWLTLPPLSLTILRRSD